MIGLDPLRLFAVAIGLLVGITVHEFSHALVAYRLGDTTAKRMGRLSLNPLVHLDPLGTLMMVITALGGFGIGWGKPTPVSPWNLRPGRQLGMGLVAAGGPASNMIVALFLALVLRLVPALPVVAQAIIYVVLSINLGLAAFNLLPLPMLDGFHILKGIIASFRARWAYDLGYQLERIEPHGPMILLVLILLPRVLPFIHIDPISFLVGPIFNALGALVSLVLPG